MGNVQRDKNGSSGRGPDGRFLLGSSGGPGRHTVARAIEIRQIQQECVTDDQIRAIMAKLVSMALDGDLKAAVEVFNRICGKPVDVDITEGGAYNHFPVLVTTTAEVAKNLEAKHHLNDDPLRGRKRLSDRDGK